jgi:hypothetical protein
MAFWPGAQRRTSTPDPKRTPQRKRPSEILNMGLGLRDFMNDAVLKEIVAEEGHCVIVRRTDGIYSFRFISHGNACTEGMPGPYCGLYDSADTAETEARSRYPWLNRHSN